MEGGGREKRSGSFRCGQLQALDPGLMLHTRITDKSYINLAKQKSRSFNILTRVGAHASHSSKIKDLVDLLDISHAHNSLMHAHAHTLHLHPMPTCMPIHVHTYQHARTQTFRIEGWQGHAPATGAALTGRSHPHTHMQASFTLPLAPSTTPPRLSMPTPASRVAPFVPSAPAFAPHAPLSPHWQPSHPCPRLVTGSRRERAHYIVQRRRCMSSHC